MGSRKTKTTKSKTTSKTLTFDPNAVRESLKKAREVHTVKCLGHTLTQYHKALDE